MKIADQLKGFPVRTFIRKYASIARILINDKDSSFHFKIEIDNKSGTLEISFIYRDKIITDYYRAGKTIHAIDGAVTHRCETINLNEYETVTEDRIIEAFTDSYLARKEIARKIIEEKRTAMALKIAQAIEEDKILQSARRKMDVEFRRNYRTSLKKGTIGIKEEQLKMIKKAKEPKFIVAYDFLNPQQSVVLSDEITLSLRACLEIRKGKSETDKLFLR